LEADQLEKGEKALGL